MYPISFLRSLLCRLQLAFALVVLGSVAALGQTPAWLHLAAAGTNAHAYKMRTDAAGNLYVIGHFSGTLVLDQDTLTTIGGNNYDLFIGKFSPAGNCLWARKGGNNRRDYGLDLQIAPSGRIFFSGISFPTATFGPHTVPGTNKAHSTPVIG